MALSGTRDFELDVGELIEEAFERCGLEGRTGYDIDTGSGARNVASRCCGRS